MDIIYNQRQKEPDLCRLYSLNNYYGYEKISKSDFDRYCDEYDKLIDGLKSRDMDGFAEGRSIINYILDVIDNKYVLLIPINNYSNSRNHIDINHYQKILTNLDNFFEFNRNHVWINKKINNKWYKIDSISGTNMIDNPKMNNNGYLFVIEKKLLYIEIEYYLKKIIIFFKNNPVLESSKKIEYFSITNTPEILLYNLFFSLKQIPIILNNYNLEYSKSEQQIVVLYEITKNLNTYILYLRNNKSKEKIFECYKKLKKLCINLELN